MVVFLQLLSLLILSVLGFIVWRQRPRDTVHIGFLFFSLSLSLWIASGLLANIQFEQAVFLNKLVFIFPILLLLSGLDLAIKLTKRHTRVEMFVGVLAIVAVIVTLMTDSIVAGVIPRYSDEVFVGYNIERGKLYFAYIFFLIFIAATAFSYLVRRLRYANGRERDQIKIVSMGLFFGLVSGLLTAFILPNLLGHSGPANFNFITAFLIAIAFAYAIVKYDLFDIKLAAVRGVAYGGVLITLSAVYYMSAYVLTTFFFEGDISSTVSISPVNIILALTLAFLFQPLKRFFDRVTDNIFYRDQYDTEAFFGSLSDLLASTIDLRGLLEKASHQISTTFKAEQAFFFVYYTNEAHHHMSAGTKGHSKLPVHDIMMLDQYVQRKNEKIFLTDMLLDEYEHIRRMLVSHGIGLVMPLWHEGRAMGYVLLGEHQSGKYTKRDLNVLMAVSSELVIAIQNALLVYELKELNATLQQRIDVATKELRSSNNQLKHLDEVKDEFISMASHQLRTPLTSVKGYLSMVLDGDAGAVTPRQQTLLREAFNSSERMVRLIADFLNVSRLQTGKFTIDKRAIDFKNLVKQEVTNLELIAKTRGMKLRINVTDKDLPVEADEAKLQQVVMNFIDNAIYYSRPKGTIIINLERIKHSAVLTVVDTGIGVPEEEQPKLFHKFYRAKNARRQRPDGTGVGLFMARRVVEAHGGTIIFSSREGKGSTFGFRIPLDESEHGQ
tara:strand:- start:4274 stop:6442 length:2169 start_codon:yes stop_codon:yes gene_type:complete